MYFGFKKRRVGQVAIFVIVAVVLVASVLAFFALRGSVVDDNIPEEFRPVYSYYESCIEQSLDEGLNLAGAQGGIIYLDEIEFGSEYAPFGNHLNFLGNPVPYWFYQKGNGLLSENVPSSGKISDQLNRYVEQSLAECDFEEFYVEGFYVESQINSVQTIIGEDEVTVQLSSPLVVSRDGESARKESFEVSLRSQFGSLYLEAVELYNKQVSEAFLERYAVDVLRLTVPVDGVEISCSPEVWNFDDLGSELKSNLQANFQAIKFDGNYYSLDEDEDKYFEVDFPVDSSVQLLYLPSWPSKIEVFGEDVRDGLLISEPVGNQEGLGILGFCYVPYHFVYDLSFPVMFQLFRGDEMFQFPVSVVVNKNLPRDVEITPPGFDVGLQNSFDLCEFQEQEVLIRTFDSALNSVDSNISYRCFNQVCDLGETNGGVYAGGAPACVNGYLTAEREGYASEEIIFSSNDEIEASLILSKEFSITVSLDVDGRNYSGDALVLFDKVSSDGENVAGSKSILLPHASKVDITSGLYDAKVYAYSNRSVTLPARSSVKCVEVPSPGLFGGLFGGTDEECFDVNIPEQEIGYSVYAGGSERVYLSQDTLEAGNLVVSVSSLPVPQNAKDLQTNLELIDQLSLEVRNG